jgi:hypothetical protein
MRFTPEILRKHAQVLVDKETKRDRSILAAYLRGSLLYGSPLIDGVGDIDLVFIHNSPPARTNQILKLTPEIHFDIEHHDKELYRKPREVRVDPWLGPSVHDALPLYDPRHFLDYTQAGVRSNFFYPENIQARTNPLVESSRQFWMDRQVSPPLEIIAEFPAYLSALEKALNAVSLLIGPPLPTRRLGSIFPQKARAAGAPGLAMAFSHLLGAVSTNAEHQKSWILSWEEAIDQLADEDSPNPLLAERKTYYLSAIQANTKNPQPIAWLWPLITTWTEAVVCLPDHPELQPPWIKALTTLGFAGKDYQAKLSAFDSFLEICETLILGETAEAET